MRNTAPARRAPHPARDDRAEGASALLYSDKAAREMSGAPSIYADVTADTLNAHSREWMNGYAALVSYVCRHGGPPATSAKTHGFAVGAWLNAQYTSQLSGIQRAALMAIPGVTLSRAPKSPLLRGRSPERDAAWLRIQKWAHSLIVGSW
ncbi:helicase associated domain-containing protein [Mycobacteroides abscessus]|uniref:helicase associated domain-containing protein n=1 Tax=Mycobacteroides abscessus TaxID=36809 RepID=UPI000928F9AE|nr:helicase associated domain-containing protein [Mycobacteroides abscessus]SHQ50233.1 Helicase associated domain [Mycobacteroides abscessus subsp. abscessus]SKQ83650.1 Helicase associated domain [Mycobacteroides abscessus subsp. massiliense]SLC49834.1 Helicase associated domain [Mycobacteroides abscessus subsp. massiliense]